MMMEKEKRNEGNKIKRLLSSLNLWSMASKMFLAFKRMGPLNHLICQDGQETCTNKKIQIRKD